MLYLKGVMLNWGGGVNACVHLFFGLFFWCIPPSNFSNILTP